MKKIVLLTPAFLLFSCSLIQTQQHDHFIADAAELSSTGINVLSAGDIVYVELTASPSTPYFCDYTISAPSVLSYESDYSFDFSLPFTVGGSVTYVWKFTAFASGKCIALRMDSGVKIRRP